MRRSNTGAAGWAATTAVVVGYDLWAVLSEHQTMSAYFARQIADPRRRTLLGLVWALLTWHLFGGKPDPLRITSNLSSQHYATGPKSPSEL